MLGSYLFVLRHCWSRCPLMRPLNRTSTVVEFDRIADCLQTPLGVQDEPCCCRTQEGRPQQYCPSPPANTSSDTKSRSQTPNLEQLDEELLFFKWIQSSSLHLCICANTVYDDFMMAFLMIFWWSKAACVIKTCLKWKENNSILLLHFIISLGEYDHVMLPTW